MSIAKRITKLIDKKSISRYQLAKLSKVPYTTLIKVIDGTTKNPQIDTLNSIAAALNVSIDDITQPWASEIIEGLLETYGFSYEDLAKGTGLSVDYLRNIDDLVPEPWDYELIDKVAKFLHISSQPIRAALARQEPPAYDGSPTSPEEAFANLKDDFANEKFDEAESISIHRDSLTEEEILTLAAHQVGHEGKLTEEQLSQIKLAMKIALMKNDK